MNFGEDFQLSFQCSGSNNDFLFTREFSAHNVHWINKIDSTKKISINLKLKYKHPQSMLIGCKVNFNDEIKTLHVESDMPIRALNIGQYATFYGGRNNNECLGSAEVINIKNDFGKCSLNNNISVDDWKIH